MTDLQQTAKPVKLVKSMILSALGAGGLFASISITGQTLSEGFANIRIQGVVMPALMGIVAGSIIGYLVARNRKLLTEQLELERIHTKKLSLQINDQIKELRHEVAERIAAQKLAESANRAKTQFLSSMSHELRTPLNAIMGFGQLLESDSNHPLEGGQKDAVRHILRGGAHLLELINQTLDLAKIESGSLVLSIEPVDTDPVIADCLTMAMAMADKRGICVKTDLPDNNSVPIVMADQMRLRQILLNLLSNAVKYNTEGGSITLSCSVFSSGKCRFSVSDTGQGIAEEYHDKVFTPFNRLAEEGGAKEGTGIGLAITRQIVELMGGEIGFSSAKDEGSTFWFDLPTVSETEALQWTQAYKEKEDATISGNVELHPCTVLYVEDNSANLKLMKMILDRVGALTLHSAHTAEIGIEIAHQVHPDLILMDINLPGIDGVQALKELRKDPQTRDIPVIAVSANAMPHDINTAMRAGFESYITKPFDIPDVMEKISTELTRKVEIKGDEPPVGKPIAHQAGDYAPLDEEEVGRLFSAAATLPAKYVTVLKRQAATLPVLIAKLRSLAGDGEAHEAEITAHTLKTNSGTFGARELWAQAQKAEAISSNGGFAEIGGLVDGMEDEYEIVAPVLERLLKDLEAAVEETR